MPSFDIVSQVNSMEIENAVNMAKKELANRFDFKGTAAEIVLDKNEIKLSAESAFKLTALREIVIGKIAKRNISLKSIEQCEPEVSPLGHARQLLKVRQGIETEIAKQVTGFIRSRGQKRLFIFTDWERGTAHRRSDLFVGQPPRQRSGPVRPPAPITAGAIERLPIAPCPDATLALRPAPGLPHRGTERPLALANQPGSGPEQSFSTTSQRNTATPQRRLPHN